MLLNKKIMSLLAAISFAGFLTVSANDDSIEALRNEIREMKRNQAQERESHQKELEELKSKISEMRVDHGIRSKKVSASDKIDEKNDLSEHGVNYRSKGLIKAEGLKIGAYGEMLYRWREQSVSAFDPRRLVLLPSYVVNDWIVFNSEIEIEHGGAGTDFTADGNIEIEQAYVDFLFNEHINWRSLGLDVLPIGRINLFHEPTVFYSTDRPELYREIIPSTWREGATSFFGKVVDGLQYHLMISSGLEDRSAANGINGNNGLRGARPSSGEDFNQTNGTPALTARLSYQPPFIPGLDGSTSYHHSETSSTSSAFALGGDINVDLIDTEARYFVPRTGLELRADYAIAFISNNRALQANNDGDASNNVGTHMWGAYVEAAYHFWPEDWKKGRTRNMDFIPFVRFTHLDLQAGVSRGTDVNASSGGNDRDIWTFGFALFPVPEMVLKMDYRVVDDNRKTGTPNGAERNQIQAAAGFFF